MFLQIPMPWDHFGLEDSEPIGSSNVQTELSFEISLLAISLDKLGGLCGK